METIYEEIYDERAKQDAEWGGPLKDDDNSSNDWVACIAKHVGRAVTLPGDRGNFRKQMIRVAALAVAAIEWCDRRES